MKIGISNGVFSKYSLTENLRAVGALGFKNVEFNMKCVEENDEDSVYEAKKNLDSLGLTCMTVHAATLHVEEECEIPKAVYYGRVSVDFSSILSSSTLVVHSNISRGIPADLREKFLEKIFGKLIPYARERHIQLALENLSYASNGYGKNVAELQEILNIIDDGSMGITLDFCHAEATGVTHSIIEDFHKKICNVHLSDRAHRPLYSETPRLKTLLKRLRYYNYNGPLTIELNRKCSIEEIESTKNTLEKLVQ